LLLLRRGERLRLRLLLLLRLLLERLLLDRERAMSTLLGRCAAVCVYVYERKERSESADGGQRLSFTGLYRQNLQLSCSRAKPSFTRRVAVLPAYRPPCACRRAAAAARRLF
jgi:hypothetical protein